MCDAKNSTPLRSTTDRSVDLRSRSAIGQLYFQADWIYDDNLLIVDKPAALIELLVLGRCKLGRQLEGGAHVAKLLSSLAVCVYFDSFNAVTRR